MTDASKTIFISGGTSSIGAAVIRNLIKNSHHKVVNIDNVTHIESLKYLSSIDNDPRYSFENVDFFEPVAIKRVFEYYCPDIVMHVSSQSHKDEPIEHSAKSVQTNIVGIYRLLEQTKAYYTSLTQERKAGFRFHYISNSSISNSADDTDIPQYFKHATPPGKPLYLQEHNKPEISPYIASKTASEHIVKAWQKTCKLPIIITHCTTNYGPYYLHENFIPNAIKDVLAEKSLSAYLDNSKVKDWLHIDDHASALVLVALKGRVGETYYIGGHNKKKDIEVINHICEALDVLKPKEFGSYTEQIAQLKAPPNNNLNDEIDITKICQQLGWQPEISFETGISKTIEWHLNNNICTNH